MNGVLCAFAGYLLAAMIVTFPLIMHFGRSVSDPVDPLLNSWVLAWGHHALLNAPHEYFNANIFYPHKATLLYSETLLVPTLLLLPIKVATGNAILTHNFLVLAGFTLTGTNGYLLGRWLFRNHWSGWVLGGVLALNTYMVSNIGQAQLLHLEWLPLTLLYLGKALRRPSLRAALLFAVYLAAQFYTAIYYGMFSFVIVGLVGGAAWLVYLHRDMRVRVHAFGLLVAGYLIALALCLPLAIPYYLLSQQYGFERTLADAWPFSASLEMWATARANNMLYGAFMGRDLPKLGYYRVDALFPGIFLLLTASVSLGTWFARSLRRRGAATRWHRESIWWPLLLLAGIMFFFVLSLGPYPQITSLQPNFETVLPYAWLHAWIPGFHALRAPGRFAIVVFLGLALVVAYLFQKVHSRVTKFLILLLLGVETLALNPLLLFSPVTTSDQHAAYAWLAVQPRSTFLEIPVYPLRETGDERRWLETQFQSMHHWHATPAGYSGFFPPRHYELQAFLAEFPRAEVIHFLQVAGVEWLVLHQSRMTEQEWATVATHITEQQWEAHQWGAMWVVRLPTVKGSSPKVSYYVPEVAQRGGLMGVGAIFTRNTPSPLPFASNVAHVRVEWWQEERRVLVVERVFQPPFYVDRVAVSTVRVPVPDAMGVYTLRLRGEGKGEELATATVTVINDNAPPEGEIMPVRALDAEIVCGGGEVELDILMQTVGWYDTSFTLSARLVDSNGVEVARSAADVEFPPDQARKTLLGRHHYRLPLDAVPNAGQLAIDLVAYRWQQVAERIVPRHFVTDEGAVVNRVRLPLELAAVCKKLSMRYP